jgi:excisionase family DNA binding protein
MTPDDLLNLVKTGIREVEKERESQETKNRSYSLYQASKELGRHYTTVKRLIEEGKIKTTSDGRRITAQAINDYLKCTG